MAKELSFEDKMNKLQEIVDLLEQGKITLAESVKLYKEGLELTQKCKEELEKAKILNPISTIPIPPMKTSFKREHYANPTKPFS